MRRMNAGKREVREVIELSSDDEDDEYCGPPEMVTAHDRHHKDYRELVEWELRSAERAQARVKSEAGRDHKGEEREAAWGPHHAQTERETERKPKREREREREREQEAQGEEAELEAQGAVTAEGADVMASASARLFRFDAAAGEWVDRGSGRALVCRGAGAALAYVKFVEGGSKKCRALHNIVPRLAGMRLEPHQDRAVRYQCIDMADGSARGRTFAVSFSHADEQMAWEREYMLAWEQAVPRVPLLDMIRSGSIEPGRDVLAVPDKSTTHYGTLLPDGRIECRGHTFDAPTAFATFALSRPAGNGWERVRYGTLKLSDLRRTHLSNCPPLADTP